LQAIGKYEIVDQLGSGSMGIVYRAVDKVLDREVALKVLRAEPSAQPELMERFRREARACARLQHPNIVTVYDLGFIENTAFMAMELLDGTDWRRAIREKLRLNIAVPVQLELMAQVCDGLGHAHASGIVHRDVKPSNLFIDRRLNAKILDFGIARLPTSMLTMRGRVLGTPDYMAPEQILGETCEARSDLFAAAIVFFEFLTGVHPFRAPFIPRRISNGTPEQLNELAPLLPQIVGDIFNKALSREAAMRYQTGGEFSSALRAAADQVRSELNPAIAHDAAGTAPDGEMQETASLYLPEENH
jgi:serine/threonine protein kinase